MALDTEFKETIRQLIAKEEAKKKPLEDQLELINQHIKALQTTLSIFGDYPAKQEIQNELFMIPSNELRENAHSIPEALEYIGKRLGSVHYYKAAEMVIKAGLSHGKTRNVASHIYRTMMENKKWERIAQGTFRLKTPDENIMPKMT